MLRRLLRLDALPININAGLLALRIIVGGSLFIRHGFEKLTEFHRMAPTFSNPIHIGSEPSLIIAMISDGICSVLIMIGLGTRWASAYCFATIATAWIFRYHFLFLGKLEADHGELMVLYLAGFLALFLTGPGRYSIDEKLSS